MPTIYDVARDAGVSIATVSRVLNEPDKVKDQTRNLVLQTIGALGYEPKAEARARAMLQNKRIGVITPHLTSPAFVERLRGVAEKLRDTNYELVIYSVESTAKFYRYLETLPFNHYLDGLIILSLQFDDRFAQSLLDHRLETVVVEYPHTLINSVEIDDYSGGCMAANYLVQKGFTHIGFVGDTVVPEFGIQPVSQRLSGFRTRLVELGVSLDNEDILKIAYDVEATSNAALQFLARPNFPNAIFAATDLQAIAVIKAARQLGFRVPQDLAVIGFDDLDAAEYVDLTTIRQHLDESGRIAAELLLSRISDPSRPVQHIKLPLTLIERQTV
jgi:DNA-binding LacI/PurR family transcriptional regulator